MSAEAKSLPPGSLVHVLGDDGHSFGTGYFNLRSLIAVRLLAAAEGTEIDAAFFAGRFKHALGIRNTLFERPYYRLSNAEGDLLPGLVVDRFDDICVVQVTTAGMELLLPEVIAALEIVLAPSVIVLRNDAPARTFEGLESVVRSVKGEARRITVEENDVQYFADLGGGQKTGWYYDQRDNRAFVARLAKGKSTLDAFCYSGGFALAAAKQGAKEVVGLDSSAPALGLAEESAAANRLAAKFVKSDVMEELVRLADAKETFDLVVADPPPFVPSRKDLESGARAYRKLARLAASVTAANGFLFMASCSHNISAERFSLECAAGIARAGRKASLIRQAGAGPDHPIHPMLPENSYLKALVYALD